MKSVWDVWQVNETVRGMGVDVIEARQHLQSGPADLGVRRQSGPENERPAEGGPGGPAEFVAMWGDEQRRALDGNFYTADEFCKYYRDKYTVETLWYYGHGNGIENDYMLDHARREFPYLMNA